ncbi:MAG: hypothetical protein K8T25_16095 [Planctomycetia bacterium]|nr:hypothetical protein [Planctomycetia bacterium]
MDSPPAAANVTDRGTVPTSRRRRVWLMVLWSLGVLVPLALYVGIYLGCSERMYLWGGFFSVKYPGLMRTYALTPKASVILGSSEEILERDEDKERTVRRFNESLLQISPGGWHHLWRIFYPAERIEMAMSGNSPLAIEYSNSAPAHASPTSPAALPLIGLVYREWFVRDNILYRFVQGVYAARDSSHTQTKRNDVYLFEWPLDGAWNDKPRVASRVRLVETNSRNVWDQHWIVDADHLITWNERPGEARLLSIPPQGKPATMMATIPNLRPVRCNTMGPISVSPTARFFAGEKDGLTIFRGDTFEVARRVPESEGTRRFFQSRPDELNNTNSVCHLSDDGTTLLLVVNIFKPDGDRFVSGTTVVLFNFQNGEVRDIPVKLGIRADVHRAHLVNGKLTLYVTYTKGDGKWQQCLLNPEDQTVIDLHPENSQPDIITMGWDTSQQMMVDLPGFEANPQPLDKDSEVCIEKIGIGNRTVGKLRYGDSSGTPSLFTPGIIKFSR